PKKKTSHSKKRMRSASKGLKDKTNIVNCRVCGQRRLTHHLELYSNIIKNQRNLKIKEKIE
ncbi:6811_t:CDS:2, partial [Scutellospora calospora]